MVIAQYHRAAPLLGALALVLGGCTDDRGEDQSAARSDQTQADQTQADQTQADQTQADQAQADQTQADETPDAAASAASGSNVLLVILDDIGLDAVSCYEQAESDARTPRLDQLAARGVRFDRVWANPSCSPTRATILSGRYGFRTGIGSVRMARDGVDGLSPSETCIPEAILEVDPTIRTAFLGKWHLGIGDDFEFGPRAQGFHHFRGTGGNLRRSSGGDAYSSYDEIVDGVRQKREQYATSAVVDDTLAAIERFGDDRWFVVTSFHAAHTPLHAPPENLHTRDLPAQHRKDPRAFYMAMVEALDTELGRLLDGLGDDELRRTHVLVVGDNGGASHARAEGAAGRAGKGSLFEDGIRVPLVAAGPSIDSPGRASHHLVNTTDLHATVVELCTGRRSVADADSVSLAPALSDADAPPRRDWILAERFRPAPENGSSPAIDLVAVTTGRFKLISDGVTGRRRLYDVESDPHERVNLTLAEPLPEDAASALARLEEILDRDVARDLPWQR